MATPEEIIKAAKAFHRAVIDGMKNRPAEYEHDSLMAKAAGLKPGIFCDYKNDNTGLEHPDFYVIYQVAYLLAHGPPCSLKPENMQFNRFREALKKDKSKILEKLISLILAESDLDYVVNTIDLTYQKNFSPQEVRQDS